MNRLFILLLMTTVSFGPLLAQKYGHLNFANLLSQMPGTKAAETQLAAFNQERVEQGEKMVADLRAKVLALENEVQDLTPKALQERRVALNVEREKIVRYEQQMGIDVEKKRQELLGPLITQAREAIDRVAEQKGYQLIFDTSQFNTILYGQDSDDLMPVVKAELGM